MKKLLSLLSVLTISGSVVPTTIAASPYQKKENKKIENSEINYLQQIGNLENLKRSKRTFCFYLKEQINNLNQNLQKKKKWN